MNKLICVVSAPVSTVSGYGAHSRDIVRSLIKILDDTWEIKISSTNWGDTPMNALDDVKDNDLISRLLTNPLTIQPELYIQISTPAEANPIGRYNILITAGIETDRCSGQWLDGVNRMDLTIMPSNFSKSVFEKTDWNIIDNKSRVLQGKLKLEKPIEVLFEGIDTSVYYKTDKISDSINAELNKIKQNFCFLFVGHWIRAEVFHDRKSIGTLIYNFLDTFAGVGNAPALVLKTSQATFSITDREHILKQIDSIRKSVQSKLKLPEDKMPDIYLLHGSLTDTDMNDLYNHPKIKALVSYTKGEGYGRPMAEFSVTEKPIIATNWSGHLDFLNSNYVTLLPGKLEKIHKSAVWENILIPESKWFYVDIEAGKVILRDVKKNYEQYRIKAKKQAEYIKQFDMDNMTIKFKDILDKYLPNFPKPMEIILPELPVLNPK